MTWFKVDDGLHSHPKWLAVSPAARALWVTAGSWCAKHLTDGRVPHHALGMLGAKPRDAAELVAAGLWDSDEYGWLFHDWATFQPSAQEVREERERKAAAGRLGGLASGRSRKHKPSSVEAEPKAGAQADAEAGASRVLPEVPNPRPDPTYIPPKPPAQRGARRQPQPPDPYTDQRAAALARANNGQTQVRAIAAEPADPHAAERIAALRGQHHLPTKESSA